MMFFYYILAYIKQKHILTINQIRKKKAFLQANLIKEYRVPKSKDSREHVTKRISLWTRSQKGSITVEASLAAPVFLFALINLMSIMDMIGVSSGIEMALHQAGKEMAVYAYAGDSLGAEEGNLVLQGIETGLSPLLVKSKVDTFLKEGAYRESVLENGTGGIVYIRSSFLERDCIDLVAEYTVKAPVSFFTGIKIPLINRCRMRAWTGYDNTKTYEEGENDETYVYITKTGTVYHTSRTCTHLELSIHKEDFSHLSSLRNENGGKYKPCELCEGKSDSSVIFVAEQGDRYHKSLDCSGLSRTVFYIRLSEAGGRAKCLRCQCEKDFQVSHGRMQKGILLIGYLKI